MKGGGEDGWGDITSVILEEEEDEEEEANHQIDIQTDLTTCISEDISKKNYDNFGSLVKY